MFAGYKLYPLVADTRHMLSPGNMCPGVNPALDAMLPLYYHYCGFYVLLWLINSRVCDDETTVSPPAVFISSL